MLIKVLIYAFYISFLNMIRFVKIALFYSTHQYLIRFYSTVAILINFLELNYNINKQLFYYSKSFINYSFNSFPFINQVDNLYPLYSTSNIINKSL